jgi:hypothetical protein
MVGVVVRDHRVEPEPPRVLGGDRGADDARGVPDDEGHLVGGAKRGGNDQVALALAVVVVGHDDDLAIGEGLQDFRNWMGHEMRFPV